MCSFMKYCSWYMYRYEILQLDYFPPYSHTHGREVVTLILNWLTLRKTESAARSMMLLNICPEVSHRGSV